MPTGQLKLPILCSRRLSLSLFYRWRARGWRVGEGTAINPSIYHITHLDNLAGIIRDDRLWSDAQRIKRGVNCTNIGYHHLKQRRLTKPVSVAAKGMLGDYVPFNFCNRSVMLYVISRGHQNYQDGQTRVVHLVSSVSAVIRSGRPWAFTDAHAAPAYANYFERAEDFDKIAWDVMRLRQWSDPAVKDKRQAEFLVHDWFPWNCVRKIGVMNREVEKAVLQILAASDHKPIVAVEPSWYY